MAFTNTRVRLYAAIVAGLFCTSLFLPVFDYWVGVREKKTLFGWEALVIVPETILHEVSLAAVSSSYWEWLRIRCVTSGTLFVEWLPNPLFFFGLSLFLCRRFLLAALVGLVGWGLALWFGVRMWLAAISHGVNHLYGPLDSGYYVWLSSYFVLVVLSVAMQLKLRRRQAPQGYVE